MSLDYVIANLTDEERDEIDIPCCQCRCIDMLGIVHDHIRTSCASPYWYNCEYSSQFRGAPFIRFKQVFFTANILS